MDHPLDDREKALAGAVSAEPPASIRRFQHIEGFQDGTQWIEITPEGSFIVYPGGRQRAPSYTLDACVEKVARGIWKELAALRAESRETPDAGEK